jgi:hypothetical protein
MIQSGAKKQTNQGKYREAVPRRRPAPASTMEIVQSVSR